MNDQSTIAITQSEILEFINTLDDFNLKSYLKTSGGKGYHVLVHFKNRISWEEFTQIAQNIALKELIMQML